MKNLLLLTLLVAAACVDAEDKQPSQSCGNFPGYPGHSVRYELQANGQFVVVLPAGNWLIINQWVVNTMLWGICMEQAAVGVTGE